MNPQAIAHLGDAELVRDLVALISSERTTTAAVLAHLAEVDARKLYLPAAYPSMYAYCVHELRFSEDAAAKRIQAARIAREFPAIFEALAEGRVHLGAVCLLAPHLNPENVAGLLHAAMFKTKAEIMVLLAERFPRSESLALVEAMPAQHAPGHVNLREPEQGLPCVNEHAPGHVATTNARIEPIAAERFQLQVSMGRGMNEKLRYAAELLGHQVASGDVAEVLERGLDALIARLEKRKFGATSRPQRNPRPTRSARHVPAHVKRAVCQRDQKQCTFVSDAGRRCCACKHLEFDHIEPVARGGLATVENLRLRCRAHNQHDAEGTFGVAFMERKRETARGAPATATTPAHATATTQVEQARATATMTLPETHLADCRREHQATAPEQDVTPWLRKLGFRSEEVRRAVTYCADYPDAPLKRRVLLALRFLRP